MSFDINRVASLLHIVEKAKQWPELRVLHDEALAELRGQATKISQAPQKLAEEQAAHAETKGKIDELHKAMLTHEERIRALEEAQAEDEPEVTDEPETVKRREVPQEVE